MIYLTALVFVGRYPVLIILLLSVTDGAGHSSASVSPPRIRKGKSLLSIECRIKRSYPTGTVRDNRNFLL